jgi:hypothetical protein
MVPVFLLNESALHFIFCQVFFVSFSLNLTNIFTAVIYEAAN